MTFIIFQKRSLKLQLQLQKVKNCIKNLINLVFVKTLKININYKKIKIKESLYKERKFILMILDRLKDIIIISVIK